MDGSESEIVQNKQQLILTTACKCYIMKIKAIFQNSFKTKKTLSYTDIFQEKKTIQGVSMKSDGEEHTSANHRRHSRTQP